MEIIDHVGEMVINHEFPRNVAIFVLYWFRME